MVAGAYSSEKSLAYLYSIGGFASLLQIICTAIIWLHWRGKHRNVNHMMHYSKISSHHTHVA